MNRESIQAVFNYTENSVLASLPLLITPFWKIWKSIRERRDNKGNKEKAQEMKKRIKAQTEEKVNDSTVDVKSHLILNRKLRWSEAFPLNLFDSTVTGL